jgi:hypothetical protein
MPRLLLIAAACAIAASFARVADALAQEVSFRNDIMAVLSKAGCNQGVCHGNQNGKGGFKLSLRGQEPDFDIARIVREQGGRRIDRLAPDESLLLKKPTAQVAHEGGKRFATDAPEYALLRAWVAAGAVDDAERAARLVRLEVTPKDKILVEPEDEVQLSVVAHFSDGSSRDVTRLAVYDPTDRIVAADAAGLVHRLAFGETTVLVRYLDRQVAVPVAFVPARPDFAWAAPPPANFVDEHVWTKLRSQRMTPSPLCNDSAFLRRAYFDLVNLLPTADEARAFVADPNAEKRAQLVDRLLKRPEFATAWALKWSDLLRVEEKTLDRKGVQAFHHWIECSIAHAMPLDQFARDVIAARGSTYQSGPANFYRALRDPMSRAEAVAQVFLGVRLQCAKCHSHPFERWTQDDYYDWAGLFARVDYKILDNGRLDKNDSHEFDGEQIVWMKNSGEVVNPRTDAPAMPRLLGEAAPSLSDNDDRLEAVARWVGSPVNRLFARAQVNRIWYHLMGRGLVEPIDDFRETNPAVNPPLLDALAQDFVDHGFDLRHTIRLIMTSRTYQLATAPNDTNAKDERNFSRALVRRLSAEQLLDAVHQVAGVAPKFNGYPAGLRAGEVPGVMAVRVRDERPSMDDKFLTVFGKPPRLLSCECERSVGTTLGQAFQMISGPLVNDLLAREDGRLARLAASSQDAADVVDELYWAALSRAASAEERAAALSHLARSASRRQGLEDIAWALLNAKEFVLRY